MRNVGARDSQVRWILGLAVFILSFFEGGAAHWVLLGAAVVLVATAYSRFCPLWFGFRVNTHSRGKKP